MAENIDSEREGEDTEVHDDQISQLTSLYRRRDDRVEMVTLVGWRTTWRASDRTSTLVVVAIGASFLDEDVVVNKMVQVEHEKEVRCRL